MPDNLSLLYAFQLNQQVCLLTNTTRTATIIRSYGYGEYLLDFQKAQLEPPRSRWQRCHEHELTPDAPPPDNTETLEDTGIKRRQYRPENTKGPLGHQPGLSMGLKGLVAALVLLLVNQVVNGGTAGVWSVVSRHADGGYFFV